MSKMNKKSIVSIAIICAATVVGLLLFDRHFWCELNDLRLSTWDFGSAHQSQHLFDQYSFTHIEHGFVFYALLAVICPKKSFGFRLSCALALAGGWEILENSTFVIDRYRAQTIDAGYYGDSIANSLADMLCCAAGFWFTYKFKWWALAVMIVFEVGLALTIRDNLILNIIMLIHSSPAILDWQASR